MGSRFDEVEPSIMVIPLAPDATKRALKRPMEIDGAMPTEERLALLLANEERKAIAKKLYRTIKELRSSLEDFTLQDVSIVENASFLLPEHARHAVAGHLARGLCGAAGETLLWHEPHVLDYLAEEAYERVVLPSGVVLCECDMVARYVEECLLAKHGRELAKALKP